MSSWLRTGTVNVTQGSTQVIGVGVKDWLENLPGWELVIGVEESTRLEIKRVVSANELELASPVTRATATGLQYGIIPTAGLTLKLTRNTLTLQTVYSGMLDQLGLGLFGLWQAEPGNDTGTVAEFLTSLEGPQGPQGGQGIQGIQGEQGIQGVTGETGEQGPQGLSALELYQASDPANAAATLADYEAHLTQDAVDAITAQMILQTANYVTLATHVLSLNQGASS